MKINKNSVFAGIVIVSVITIIGFLAYVEIASSSVVPVLMYHSVHALDRDTSLYVSPEIFAAQMEFLAKNHYNVVGPDEVIAYMEKKEQMPPKTVAITADDGFYNFYQYAFPVLKKYNLKATIFIITDKIGKPGRLGWNELREMSGSGLVIIGSHTKSHPWLPSISVDAAKMHDEIVVSKEVLEKGLGKKVDYICYPNGAFNDAIKEAVKTAGYKGGFTTNPAKYNDIGDIYAIRRIKMSSSSSNPLILWGKLTREYAWFKEHRCKKY